MKAKILMLVGVAVGSAVGGLISEIFAIPYNRQCIKEDVKDEMDELFKEAGIKRESN